MHEIVNDPVDVLVSFFENRIIPKRIRWNRRTYEIKKINLIHTSREGAKRLFYFSVSDALHSFKLRLDTDTLEWRLMEAYADG